MRGTILILLAAVLWGTTGTSQAFAPAQATPLGIGTMRLLVGGSALMLLAVSRGYFRSRTGWMQPATLVAGLSTALYQLTFFAGVALTGIAVGTIVAIGSAPVFSGILGYLLLGEPLRPRWMIATVLAILGGTLLVFSGNETMHVHPLGMLLTLLSGFSYSLFAVANKRLLAFHPADAAMAVSFSLGAIFLLPALFFVDVSWALTMNGLLIVLHLGLFATGLAYMLYGRGLQTVTVGAAGTLALLEPVTAALLGVLLVGERLSALAIMGMVLILVGLLVLVTER